MYLILFIHSSVDGHLVCFHFLVIKSNAAMNIHIQTFVCTYIFISPGQIPANGIAEYHSNFVLHVLRNCQAVFQRGYGILHSNQCTKLQFLHSTFLLNDNSPGFHGSYLTPDLCLSLCPPTCVPQLQSLPVLYKLGLLISNQLLMYKLVSQAQNSVK